MPSFPRNESLNVLLNTSLLAIETYTNQIEQQSKPAAKKITPTDAHQALIVNLENVLAMTRSALQKHIDADTIVHVDPKTIRALEKAINKLAIDASTENKVNAAHFAIYGNNIPFWTELKSLQQLLQTSRGLKRGEKAAAIDEEEKDSKEE